MMLQKLNYILGISGIPSGNIIRLNDPTVTDFLKVIASNPKFPSNRTLTSDSELFIYYSGHGYVNPQNQNNIFSQSILMMIS